VFGWNPGFTFGAIQAAQKQASADQQYQRERNFTDDKTSAQALPSKTALPEASASFEHIETVQREMCQAGALPNSTPRQWRQSVNNSTVASIADIQCDRAFSGAKTSKPAKHPQMQLPTQRGANEREHDALRHSLADQVHRLLPARPNATSLQTPDARASIRPAILEQAISSTKPTAPSSTSKGAFGVAAMSRERRINMPQG